MAPVDQFVLLRHARAGRKLPNRTKDFERGLDAKAETLPCDCPERSRPTWHLRRSCRARFAAACKRFNRSPTNSICASSKTRGSRRAERPNPSATDCLTFPPTRLSQRMARSSRTYSMSA